ncbi:hypothetical protein B0H10DRAFT_1971714 [Mycena sp. CBHHK59/15]|nr:hypothetical protein B0H10DRAFT_1971714 [Mycena sp. CBHHK59/15]
MTRVGEYPMGNLQLRIWSGIEIPVCLDHMLDNIRTIASGSYNGTVEIENGVKSDCIVQPRTTLGNQEQMAEPVETHIMNSVSEIKGGDILADELQIVNWWERKDSYYHGNTSVHEEIASDSESETGTAYTWPSQWSSEFIAQYSPYKLCPHPTCPPLADITPMPDSFSRTPMKFLGFRHIQWDEEPSAFIVLQQRIGAFFIGPPAKWCEWEKNIIEGGVEHNLKNAVVLAELRYTPAIQAITSFQNNELFLFPN